ncbi:hypothetical protein [Dactylococcopsis salina]|uniref:hypothetical protein n=1 Tax=Dactylococcopsis salina TaxID=292566 RepID=UPI0002EDDC0D|nr:hypothetical protein [Dactylococcopsis salina]
MLSGTFSKIGNTSHYIEILYQKARSSATPEKNICYSLFVICSLVTDYWSLGDVPWNVSTLVTDYWSLITGHWSLVC